MRGIGPVAAIGIWCLFFPMPPASAASLGSPRDFQSRGAGPAALCQKLGTDDRLRPLPASLVPAVRRLFHLDAMPAAQIRRSTYFRCLDHLVLACNLGANLPCGKADTSRRLPGAEKWCAGHPGADFIPMYVTGHDTIYRWHCRGKRAAASGPPLAIDRRGFIARFWKRIDSDP